MNVLLLHDGFPAQYRHVASSLAADPKNRVVFGSRAGEGSIPGLIRGICEPTREVDPAMHPYCHPFESAVLNGQAVFRLCDQLRRDGFVPDVICGHSGWGNTLYVAEAFPSTPILNYFEWYYHPRGSDSDFLEPSSINEEAGCRIRSRNAPILMDLAQCAWGVCPTRFQLDQFPKLFQSKISLLHDGIDTEFFKPAPGMDLVLPTLNLSGVSEIVTYGTRGMEPYRGFPQFMEAAALLLEQRPGLHIVVFGADRVAYGPALPPGQSFKQKMLEELPNHDTDRIHFTGLLSYTDYLRVLQASSAHVYLTVPFVLSWSLLEAMSAGCLIVASDTEPVREVMSDGKNGLLVDFFSPDQIAASVGKALDRPEKLRHLRDAARQTILERYSLGSLLPQHIRLIEEVAAGKRG